MKIIFSPSKEMRKENIIDFELEYKNINFELKTMKLITLLKNFSDIKISKIMSLKNNLLEQTIKNIKNYHDLNYIPAISMYNGVAYKNIKLSSYNIQEFEFMEKHLYILSALYGIVSPLTLLKNYRLDMNMRFSEINLYKFWKDEVNKILVYNLFKDEVLINLASKEFSKLIDRKVVKNIIDIDFRDFKDNKYKSISSYVKQARGAFLNEVIINKITTTQDLKKISINNYVFNEELSSEKNFVFTR